MTVFDRVPPGARARTGDDGDDRGLIYCPIDVSSGDVRGTAPRESLRHLMSMGRAPVGIVVESGKVTGYVFGEARDLT